MESPSVNATSSFIKTRVSSTGDAAGVKPWSCPRPEGRYLPVVSALRREGQECEAKGQPLLHSEFVVSKNKKKCGP